MNNTKLREMMKQVELGTKIKRRRLQWFGQVCRMEANKNQRTVLFDNHTVIKRNKSRPKETWYRILKNDFKQFNISLEEVKATILNRDQ